MPFHSFIQCTSGFGASLGSMHGLFGGLTQRLNPRTTRRKLWMKMQATTESSEDLVIRSRWVSSHPGAYFAPAHLLHVLFKLRIAVMGCPLELGALRSITRDSVVII